MVSETLLYDTLERLGCTRIEVINSKNANFEFRLFDVSVYRDNDFFNKKASNILTYGDILKFQNDYIYNKLSDTNTIFKFRILDGKLYSTELFAFEQEEDEYQQTTLSVLTSIFKAMELID